MTTPLPGRERCDLTDPRVERSRRLILDATLDELGDVGYGAMTIESIAKRAGVGKATVYRHWAGKLDLVESALNMMKDEMPEPVQDTARGQVTEMLTWLVEYLTTPPASDCLPAIVSAAHYDTSVRAFHLRFSSERRSVFVATIARGIESGEFDRQLDPERATELLVAPVFYRLLMTDRPFLVEEVAGLVRAVFGDAKMQV